MLEEAHVPFTIITERDIQEGALGQFKSLVVPGVQEMSDEVAEKIDSFVSSGGGLVATFRTSFSNKAGIVRKKPALAEVLGIKKVKGGWLRCQTYSGYDYGWPSDNVPGNLFQIDRAHPVTKGLLRKNLYSYSGRLIKAAMSADSKVLVHTRLHDAKLASSGRFFRYQPTETLADPLVYARNHKRGRVVWFAGDVDRAVWESGNSECATMLANATRWVTHGQCPVECDASPLVVLRVRRNTATGAWQIALSNYALSQIHSPGFAGTFPQKAPLFKKAISRKETPRHIAPLSDVKARISWRGRGNPHIVTLSGVQPTFRKKDGYLELTVRELREGEVIAIGGAS